MGGYWDSMRRDLLTRSRGVGPSLEEAGGDRDLAGCKAILEQCY